MALGDKRKAAVAAEAVVASTTSTENSIPQLKGTLHYGGYTNPRGELRFKTKAGKGTQFRQRKRIEDIVRLENAGFTSQAIASMLGISVTRLSSIKMTPDFLNARIQITHGIILDKESKLADIKHQRKEFLTSLLPEAWQFLANEIQKPAMTLAEKKFKFTLVQDYLDREGTLAKVSKTEIKPVDAFDFEKADAESMAVIEALSNASSSVKHSNTIDAVEINNKFSRSQTLSEINQQKALDILEAEAKILASMPTSGEVN